MNYYLQEIICLETDWLGIKMKIKKFLDKWRPTIPGIEPHFLSKIGFFSPGFGDKFFDPNGSKHGSLDFYKLTKIHSFSLHLLDLLTNMRNVLIGSSASSDTKDELLKLHSGLCTLEATFAAILAVYDKDRDHLNSVWEWPIQQLYNPIYGKKDIRSTKIELILVDDNEKKHPFIRSTIVHRRLRSLLNDDNKALVKRTKLFRVIQRSVYDAIQERFAIASELAAAPVVVETEQPQNLTVARVTNNAQFLHPIFGKNYLLHKFFGVPVSNTSALREQPQTPLQKFIAHFGEHKLGFVGQRKKKNLWKSLMTMTDSRVTATREALQLLVELFSSYSLLPNHELLFGTSATRSNEIGLPLIPSSLFSHGEMDEYLSRNNVSNSDELIAAQREALGGNESLYLRWKSLLGRERFLYFLLNTTLIEITYQTEVNKRCEL